MADTDKVEEGAAAAAPSKAKQTKESQPRYFAASRFVGVAENGLHAFEEGDEIVARLGEYFHKTGAPVNKEE